ncbi:MULTISPECIES: DUF1003 domain-containing protein [Kocuria]|uniref:DUF1003 domain-containing protein n=1 Tax=Kocuria TaxID=57493 RepID=UPI001F497B6D|nr:MULTISPECIES: DUF1003 domain-containing protein [Kocuria]MCT1723614.1 DUF1003 domain-containing protein [Kocuria marina]MCT1734440.1 DUF1003 domain-containing protein [Kocuria marina]
MSNPRRSASSQYSPGPLDQPREKRPGYLTRFRPNPDAFGRLTESFARWMGTPQFLLWMTVFVTVWLAWNTLAPESMQFDPRALNFTLLTLMLSLQASYAAPLLLLAQNRQDDRDRVVAEEDRKRGQQNLADTEYLTREIASLRIALREVATRDYVRSELRGLLEEILEDQDRRAAGQAAAQSQATKSKTKKSEGKKSDGSTRAPRAKKIELEDPEQEGPHQ